MRKFHSASDELPTYLLTDAVLHDVSWVWWCTAAGTRTAATVLEYSVPADRIVLCLDTGQLMEGNLSLWLQQGQLQFNAEE